MKKIQLAILFAVLLLCFTANAQERIITEEVLYSPKLNKQVNNDPKSRLADLLTVTDFKSVSVRPKKTAVFDDRMELFFNKTHATIIKFSDILDYPIVITKQTIKQGPNTGYLTFIRIKSKNSTNEELSMNILSDLKDLADHLFYFQHKLNASRYDSLINIFKPLALKYQSLTVKPQISEEQRKFVVQANSLNQDKKFEKAIEYYNKAIDIDPVDYPAAYSNIALLSAQLCNYDAAMFYMKKYLLLEPTATDSRSCQDKIYEWEIKIKD